MNIRLYLTDRRVLATDGNNMLVAGLGYSHKRQGFSRDSLKGFAGDYKLCWYNRSEPVAAFRITQSDVLYAPGTDVLVEMVNGSRAEVVVMSDVGSINTEMINNSCELPAGSFEEAVRIYEDIDAKVAPRIEQLRLENREKLAALKRGYDAAVKVSEEGLQEEINKQMIGVPTLIDILSNRIR